MGPSAVPFFDVRKSLAAGPGVRVTQSTYAPGRRLPEHAHANAHFCFVVRGRYREAVGRSERQRGPGTLSYQPAGVAHAEAHETGGVHLMIEMAPDVVARGGARTMRALGAPLDLSRSDAVAVARRIQGEFAAADELTPLSLEGLALELLAQSARTGDAEGGAPPRWLRLVDDCLHQTFQDPPSTTSLAELAGVHPVHLSRVYRRFHACTIGDRVRELRVQHACELIQERALGLAEVALASGFCDQSHMTRSFRRVLGVTPGRFHAGVG